MNEEQLLFEYPITEEREQYIQDLKQKQRCASRLKIFVIVSAILGMSLFFMAAIIQKYTLIFYILTAICVVFAVGTAKFISNVKLHYLFISADETQLYLEYHQPNEVKLYEIAYQSINDIRFKDKTFTKVKITFNSHSEKECLVLSLNERTPEQGFFLYTAPQILPCPAIKLNIIEKKFGNVEEYYQQIYDER